MADTEQTCGGTIPCEGTNPCGGTNPCEATNPELFQTEKIVNAEEYSMGHMEDTDDPSNKNDGVESEAQPCRRSALNRKFGSPVSQSSASSTSPAAAANNSSTAMEPIPRSTPELVPWSRQSQSQFKKKTCIIKLDGCHFTIVANTLDDKSSNNDKPRKFPRTGSLTVLKRTLSAGKTGQPNKDGGSATYTTAPSTPPSTPTSTATTAAASAATVDFGGANNGAESQIEHLDTTAFKAADLSKDCPLPPPDCPEALRACSVRLRELLRKLLNNEPCREELVVDLEYAAKVSENIYIVENSSKLPSLDDDDVLGVVEPDSVPFEVREWLTMTFTRTANANDRRRGADDRLKFRSVANAIRAGIMVDRIYRRMSSITSHDAPPDVQALLKNLDDWSFDVFAISEAGESGHVLRYVGHELLHRYDLINKFKISNQALDNFLNKVELGYSKYNNPYHNQQHAADVTQTANMIFAQSGLAIWMTDLEILATLISAIIHDYEHTGTTNAFHINTSSDLALVYNDRAVLESYHVSAAFRLMKEEEFNILSGLKPDEYRELRSLVIDLVLATDMSNHFQQIKSMKSLITAPDNLDKSQVLSLIVHCADISHPAKDWKLHQRWTELLLEEFFRQGDREESLGLPISPLCDRKSTLVAESQIGFIDFIVEPSLSVMSDAIESLMRALQQQCAAVAPASGPEDGSKCGTGDSSHNDFATPPTPKSPHFPARCQKLKQCWEKCLIDNKTRWKERAAEDAIRRAAEPEAQEDLLQQYEEVLDSDDILLDCNDEELELEILERDGREYIILPFEPDDISTSDENASFGVTSDIQLTDSATDFETPIDSR